MADERITEDSSGNLVIQQSLLSKLDAIVRGQSEGFTRLETAMKAKADKSDLAKLEGRLDEHGKQLADLAAWRHDREVASGVHQQHDDRMFTKRQKFWASVGAVAIICATILGPALANLIH